MSNIDYIKETASWCEREQDKGQHVRVQYSYSPGCWDIWEKTTWEDGSVAFRIAPCPDFVTTEEMADEAAQRVDKEDWAAMEVPPNTRKGQR